MNTAEDPITQQHRTKARSAGVVALALCLAALAFVARPAETAEAQAAEESQFVAQINALRQSQGRSTLTVHPELTNASRGWAQSMSAAGQISHAPDITQGITVPWQKVGENVGVGGTVPALMDAFINSPTHYDNLIDPLFTHVGVGVVWNGSVMYTTHRFMAWPAGVPTTTTTAAPTTTTTAAPTTTTTTAPPTTTTTAAPTTTTAAPTTTTTTAAPTTTTTATPTTTSTTASTTATPTSTSTTSPASTTTSTTSSSGGFSTSTTTSTTAPTSTSTTTQGLFPVATTTTTTARPTTTASPSLFPSTTGNIVTPTTLNSPVTPTSIPDQLAFADDLDPASIDDSLVVNEEMVRARVRLLMDMLVRVD